MSYVNPDVVGDDIPFAGPNVVAKTRQFWIVEASRFAQHSTCWCGESKGECNDCLEHTKNVAHTKINIGSGEDGNAFR